MKKLNLKDVTRYVEENIGRFHDKRIERLNELELADVLKRKNPYLFKAKNVLTSEEIIKSLLEARISSSEETIFGDWLEGLAIFICSKVFGGAKSGIDGLDLEFEHDNVRYLLAIKSGPNWANKSQKAKMLSDFQTAKRTLATSGAKINLVFINGCCYGKDSRPHKFPKNGPDYLKLCGQKFWEFVSGNKRLYLDIIEPVGFMAKERNEAYMESYAQVINRFTKEFSIQFCLDDGTINWERIVEFNSSSSR